MAEEPDIRESTREDLAAIEALYPEAFPDEELLPLVRELLSDPVIAVSLVCTIDRRIVGHAIYTRCGVVGHSVSVALLGPLAVTPARQRRGVGTALVRDGLRRLQDTDVTRVFVLGSPTYYGRFGFTPERLVDPPFQLPPEWDDAWQSQSVGETLKPIAGRLSVPLQWRHSALWAP